MGQGCGPEGLAKVLLLTRMTAEAAPVIVGSQKLGQLALLTGQPLWSYVRNQRLQEH